MCHTNKERSRSDLTEFAAWILECAVGAKVVVQRASTVRFSCHASHGEADAGAYLLRTSRTDWSFRDIAPQYLQITEVEAVFRALKSELGLRPVWHKGDNQICAHLFITVLGWYAVHLISTRLKREGTNLCWASIRNRLQNWVRIVTTLQEVGRGVISTRQDVWPSAEAAEIAHRAGVAPAFHRTRRRY